MLIYRENQFSFPNLNTYVAVAVGNVRERIACLWQWFHTRLKLSELQLSRWIDIKLLLLHGLWRHIAWCLMFKATIQRKYRSNCFKRFL